jgi:hypothetical protein
MRPSSPSSLQSALAVAPRSALVFLLLAGLYLNQHVLTAPDAETPDVRSRDTLPPTLALVTIALGPIRGLIADILWFRAVQLQDDGEYFEIIQLAEWITAIQPRNTHVWAYQAWNMCYNIAFEFPEFEDRWPWIERALDLLRRDALRANPGNLHLHGEILRIFQDRIAKPGNAEHDLFMRKWAVLMIAATPRGDRTELAELAAMPTSADELRADPDVAALLAAASPIGTDLLSPATFWNPAAMPEALSRLAKDAAHAPAWRRLGLWHRATLLRSRHRLDLTRALAVDLKYGPLDWRLPQAQTIYWGALANEARKPYGDGLDYDQLFRQGMENAMLYGRLLVDPEAGIMATSPNLEMIGQINDHYDDILARSDHADRDHVLHRQFLERAVALLCSCDRRDEAQRLYDWLGATYGKRIPELDDFLAENLFPLLLRNTPETPREAVVAALDQAYSWLAAGDVRRATGYAKFAELLWRRADAPLPPLDQLRQDVVGRLLMSDMAASYKHRLVQRTVSPDLDPGIDRPVYLGRRVAAAEVP